MNRDDFTPKTVELVKKRSAYICSNSECRCLTIAPSKVDPGKFIYIGIVAHITAAAPGGPRYDTDMTEDERTSSENAIHLCAVCASMIDKNQGVDFPTNLLRNWKNRHEAWVIENLNKNPWLATFKDEAKFEYIRNVVSLANRYRVDFGAVTTPLTFPAEYAERQGEDTEVKEANELLNEAFARKGRLARLRETLKEVYEISWEAEVVVGDDISELIKPLDDAFIKLWGTIEAYFSTKLERIKRGGLGNPQTDIWLKSCHAIIYGIDDTLVKSVDSAVDNLIVQLNNFIN